jgi:hypothetical protein
MKRQSQENLMRLCAEITRARPHIAAHSIPVVLMKLQRLASSLHNRYTAACNHAWATTEAYGARTEVLEGKAAELGESLGVAIEHQRDPRGWPLIVKFDGREMRVG